MRDERVAPQDFEAAKRNMIASFALGLESPGQVLNYHVTRWRYKLPANYWDTHPQRIMAVTAEQVQAAAKQYLDPSKLHVVAVGDATKVADILAKYGRIVKYDSEGKIIK
jgi:predicted Zn-dependent peptidase